MSWKEYYHLKNNEKVIAERWVKQIPIQGPREYDVTLDVPLPVLPSYWTKHDIQMYAEKRKKRIDMMVHAVEAIWIMEITPKLSKAAIGGCLSYRDMYIKLFQPSLPVKMGIIVEVDDQAYHDTLKNYEIQLWVV